MIDFALKFLENKSKKSLTYWKDQIKYSGACKTVCFAQKSIGLSNPKHRESEHTLQKKCMGGDSYCVRYRVHFGCRAVLFTAQKMVKHKSDHRRRLRHLFILTPLIFEQ